MMVVIMIAFAPWPPASGGHGVTCEFDEPEDVKYQMLAMSDDEPDFWDMGRDRDDDDDDDDVVVAEETPRRMIPARN